MGNIRKQQLRFTVNKKSERVIYLIPECGIGPFASRLKIFNLLEHVRDERLFVRTVSAKGQLSLTDPRLLQVAKGADVFLDTAIRFMSGDNPALETKGSLRNRFSRCRLLEPVPSSARITPQSPLAKTAL